jgi:hypothetical protein
MDSPASPTRVEARRIVSHPACASPESATCFLGGGVSGGDNGPSPYPLNLSDLSHHLHDILTSPNPTFWYVVELRPLGWLGHGASAGACGPASVQTSFIVPTRATDPSSAKFA